MKEVLRVEQTAEMIVLYLPTSILKIANDDTVIKGLKSELLHLVKTPDVFTLSLRAGDEIDHRKELKLRRMMGGKDNEEK